MQLSDHFIYLNLINQFYIIISANDDFYINSNSLQVIP